MTREEEIKNMAVQICEKYFPDIVTKNIDTKLLPTINQISNDKRKAVWACMEVAQWADQHPSIDTVKKIICYALKKTNIMLAEDLENGVEWELLIKQAMKGG